MTLFSLCLLLALAGPAVGKRGRGGGSAVTDYAVQDAILRLHNDARSQVGLPALQWDASLASSAENGIRFSCRRGGMQHDSSYNNEHSVGENLASRSAYPDGPTDMSVGELGTQSWIDERADYDYASNQCYNMCGHYTQVVWQGTSKVCCAIGTCGAERNTKYLACHYKESGNVCGWKPYGRSADYECTCITNGADLCGGGSSGGGGCGPTTGGDAGGAACVFPFTYNGVSFDGCTTKDSGNGQPWCYTSSGGLWGYCGGGCPSGDSSPWA